MIFSNCRGLITLIGLSAVMTVTLATPPVEAQRRRPRDPQTPSPTPPGPQTPPPTPGTPPTVPGAPNAPGTPPVAAKKPGDLKDYKTVITPEAKSDKGVFIVHKIEDKYYFEIPADTLGKAMVWTTEIAQLPAGFGYPGTAVGDKVVRFSRRGNKIYLRSISYDLRAGDGDDALKYGIESASVEPIIAVFDVETEGEKKAAVIDVTRYFTSDPAEFSVKGAIGGVGVDPTRSYIERMKSFPNNIEVVSNLTMPLGPPSFNPFSRAPQRPAGVSSATVSVHYSLALLPEKPMMGRLFDSRVGYFTEGFQDFGSAENRVVNREYITRYRLEKKDPTAEVSEPVKPIVYYIAREVPTKWRKWIKAGIEQWQPAFEKAGFKNAIIAKEAPSVKDDPNWDPEDARYSVVRWAPQAVENAMGPHLADPRSGEILSAHIIVWHDVLKLAEQWYFVQCANLDPRAKTLPLPEDLLGELLQYIVAHEVGHTIGLRHNHKASSSFTTAQLRDKAFTEQWGDEASIMDYGRFNYVAQPGDGARLVPKLGPYDFFAIEWGYKGLPAYKTSLAEKPELDKLASQQVTNPTLRFGGEDANAQVDPTVQTEDLGSDPIEATTLGLKNINAIAQMLIPATTKYGENYENLADIYNQLLGQRIRELLHVVKLVGGVTQTDFHAGRGGDVFTPVPKSKQASAVKFLVDNAFTVPRSLILPEIQRRVTPSGVTDQILSQQRIILLNLMQESRIKRMMDAQALNGSSNAYTVSQLVDDVQSGIWSELATSSPTVDIYRRNLQRTYLQYMKQVLDPNSPLASTSDLKAVALGAVRDLQTKLNTAALTVTDKETALHIADARMMVRRILDPK